MDLPDIFAGLSDRRIQQAFEHFRVVDVEAGVRIIEPGDEDDALVAVALGDLQIDTPSGALVGRAGANDLVGEIAFFGDGIRKLGVSTRGPCRLLLLDRDGYGALRAAQHPIVPALEERALDGLERRFASVCGAIAQHTSEAVPVARAGGGDSLVGKMMSYLLGPTTSRIAKALRSRLCSDVDPAVLTQLAALGELEQHDRNVDLLQVGERPARLSFVLSGSVEQVCQTGSRGFSLGKLGAGDALGMAAVVPSAPPSGASLLVRERVELLSFDPIRWVEATQRADAGGSALRVAAVRASGAQLLRAASVLSRLDRVGRSEG